MNTYEQSQSERVSYQVVVSGDAIASVEWSLIGGAGTAVPTDQTSTSAAAMVELFEPAKIYTLNGVLSLDSGQRRLFSTRIRCAAYVGIRAPRTTFGLIAPTAGLFIAGDVCQHSSPVPGGNLGWVCIEGGVPGVWQPFGVIGDQ